MERKINNYLLITIISTGLFIFIGIFMLYISEIAIVQIVFRTPIEKTNSILDIYFWDSKLKTGLKDNLINKNNELTLNEKYKKIFNENKLWVQLIDNEGKEVYNYLKPDKYPTEYTGVSLLNTYKEPFWNTGYEIESELVKIDNIEYTYLLGFPNRDMIFSNISHSQAGLVRYFIERAITVLFIIIISSIISAKVYSNFMIKPLFKIINSIKNLSSEKYENIFLNNNLYIDVSNNLYNLAIKLKKTKHERENLDRMRDELISNIVHDVKTPLSSMKGYIEMLTYDEYKLSTGEKRKYSNIALNKANYIDSLLEDLSLNYKLKSNIYLSNKKNHNLVEILQQLIINILNDIKYKDRNIEFEFNTENINLLCDKILIERAFNNIIYNALIHNTEETKINVIINDKKKYIEVKVIDNGNGIKESDIENLFERYYRGTSTNVDTKGSGLGLSIAKQIIENHKGSIYVESKIQKGTTIIVKF